MSDLRIPIPMIDGYAMDQHGEVWCLSTNKHAHVLTMAEAVKAWNQESMVKWARPSFLQGVGTHRGVGGRAIVSMNSLTQGDKVAWLYTTPEIIEALRKPNETFTYALPDEWIELCGSSDSGWVMIKTKQFESLFHGPSVLKHILRR